MTWCKSLYTYFLKYTKLLSIFERAKLILFVRVRKCVKKFGALISKSGLYLGSCVKV